jgi:hypothetical protein
VASEPVLARSPVQLNHVALTVRDRERSAAFLRSPETTAEADDATRLAIDSINEEPWEPWW